MRNPSASVKKLKRGEHAGGILNKILDVAIDKFPRLLGSAQNLLKGLEPKPFEPELVHAVRKSVCTSLGVGLDDSKTTSPISPSVIRGWCRVSGDPDCILASWLEQGAPIGIEKPIETSGIYPQVDGSCWTAKALRTLERSSEGWSNYKSADEEPEEVQKLLDKAESQRFCRYFDSLEELAAFIGSYPILNKLGLVSKVKADGSVKYRIIWDLKESHVNQAVSMGERVVLPRLSDFTDGLLKLLESPKEGEEISLLVVDIADAFHNVPVNRDEQRFTVAYFNGRFVCYSVLVFGAGSSPTVWGRFAGLAARSASAILSTNSVLQVYVDDPALAVAGSLEARTRLIAKFLLWMAVLGMPLSLAKSHCGKQIEWIGASVAVHGPSLRCDSNHVILTVPKQKLQTLREDVNTSLQSPVMSKKRLRSLVGSLAFIAGFVIQLRAFLAPLWCLTGRRLDDGKAKSRKFRHQLIHTKRCAWALKWISAFLLCELTKDGSELVRILRPRQPSEFSFATDASPWGMGGILLQGNCIISYFATPISPEDVAKFNATVGSSKFNTLWESLALLIAFRLWLPRFPFGLDIRCKSDSMASINAFIKLASPSMLGPIMREAALDLALGSYQLGVFEHIPGVTNVIPDALSRLWAPQPKPFPLEVSNAKEEVVPLRDSSFWRVS